MITTKTIDGTEYLAKDENSLQYFPTRFGAVMKSNALNMQGYDTQVLPRQGNNIIKINAHPPAQDAVNGN